MPVDAARAAKVSSSEFDWEQPRMVAPEEVKETYLQHTEEQLILQPDTSKSSLSSGWVLNTRGSRDRTRFLCVR